MTPAILTDNDGPVQPPSKEADNGECVPYAARGGDVKGGDADGGDDAGLPDDDADPFNLPGASRPELEEELGGLGRWYYHQTQEVVADRLVKHALSQLGSRRHLRGQARDDYDQVLSDTLVELFERSRLYDCSMQTWLRQARRLADAHVATSPTLMLPLIQAQVEERLAGGRLKIKTVKLKKGKYKNKIVEVPTYAYPVEIAWVLRAQIVAIAKAIAAGRRSHPLPYAYFLGEKSGKSYKRRTGFALHKAKLIKILDFLVEVGFLTRGKEALGKGFEVGHAVLWPGRPAGGPAGEIRGVLWPVSRGRPGTLVSRGVFRVGGHVLRDRVPRR